MRTPTLVLLALALAGCDAFADIIAESACVNNDDARACVAGEAAGTRVDSPNKHCCETSVYEKTKTCSVSGNAESKIEGFFSDYLKLGSNTKIVVDVKLTEFLAVHKFEEEHCKQHEEVCVEEVIRQEWQTDGKVTAGDKITLSAEKLGELAKAVGATQGLNLSYIPDNIGAGVNEVTQITSSGRLGSICLESDHEECAAMREDRILNEETWKPVENH